MPPNRDQLETEHGDEVLSAPSGTVERLTPSPRFLRAALDGLPGQTVAMRGSGEIVVANAAWRAFAARNGGDPAAVSEGANYLDVCERAGQAGETAAIEALRGIRDVAERRRESVEIEYPCHSPTEERWFEMRARAFAFDGETWLTVTHADITRRKRAEINEQLLTRELQHRVNNNLAVVSAIVSMTVRGSRSLESFEPLCRSRLMALSVANHGLDRHGWEGADMHEVVAWAIAPFQTESERIRAEGPPARLRAGAALHLTLTLHELCTNALRHGALTGESGRIEILWHRESERMLRLWWKERGGPPVQPPTRMGFGLSLIDSVAAAIEATAELRFEADGLRLEMALPLATAGA